MMLILIILTLQVIPAEASTPGLNVWVPTERGEGHLYGDLIGSRLTVLETPFSSYFYHVST